MSGEINVKSLRESIGWTQDRLARYLGVDRSSVSRLENRQSLRGPTLRLLETLKAAADRGEADALCPDGIAVQPAE